MLHLLVGKYKIFHESLDWLFLEEYTAETMDWKKPLLEAGPSVGMSGGWVKTDERGCHFG